MSIVVDLPVEGGGREDDDEDEEKHGKTDGVAPQLFADHLETDPVDDYVANYDSNHTVEGSGCACLDDAFEFGINCQ